MPNKKSPVDVASAKAFLNTKELVMTIDDSGYGVSAMKDLIIARLEHPTSGKPNIDKDTATIIEAHRYQRTNTSVNVDGGTKTTIPDQGREYDIAGYDVSFSNLVRRYQKENNLPETGNIGNKTKEALSQDLASLAPHIEDQKPSKRYTNTPDNITHYLSRIPADKQKEYSAEHKAYNATISKLVSVKTTTAFEDLSIPPLTNVALAPENAQQNLPARASGKIELS